MPVLAPDGTDARYIPSVVCTSTSTVGFPLESMTSRPLRPVTVTKLRLGAFKTMRRLNCIFILVIDVITYCNSDLHTHVALFLSESAAGTASVLYSLTHPLACVLTHPRRHSFTQSSSYSLTYSIKKVV